MQCRLYRRVCVGAARLLRLVSNAHALPVNVTHTTSAAVHPHNEVMMTIGERSVPLSWRYIHFANRLDAIAAPLTFIIAYLFALILTFGCPWVTS